MPAIVDFSAKFGLVLKALNLSRGHIARTVGIDKSVVSRWASGGQAPTDHNLSLLTEVVMRQKPGFSRLDWERDLVGFSVALGLGGVPSSPAPELPDKPSVAVLRFGNLGGNREEDYFGDGIAEDIITALSRFRSLFVIARNSSFSYAARDADLRQVGRELGVRYVLEGSVRRMAGRLRVTAKLVDAATGAQVWGERYDGLVEDLFELQDRITEAVAGILEPTIHQAEIDRLRRKRPEHMGAYDWFLRSLAQTNIFTRESIAAGYEAALRAIALDPGLAPAYALAGRAHIQWLSQGWIDDLARSRTEVLDLVERGLHADRSDTLMLATAGHCFAWFAHDLAKAILHIDEALAINPNQTTVLLPSGVVRVRAGDTRTAIEHIHRALRLSPRDLRSYAMFQALALAHQLEGDVEVARSWALRGVQHNPNYMPGWYALTAAAAATGRKDEACQAAARVLMLEPGFSISQLERRYPIGDRAKFEPFFDALRRAGIPDQPSLTPPRPAG